MSQDEQLKAEMQQCGFEAEDRTQNISKLYSILEQHQAAAPEQQEDSPTARCASLGLSQQYTLIWHC